MLDICIVVILPLKVRMHARFRAELYKLYAHPSDWAISFNMSAAATNGSKEVEVTLYHSLNVRQRMATLEHLSHMENPLEISGSES